MNLEDQLRGAQSGAGSANLTERLLALGPDVAVTNDRRPAGSIDPYGDLKTRIQRNAIPKLGPWLFSNEETADLKAHVAGIVAAELEDDSTPLAQVDRERLIEEISADILGYGPLEPFLADDSVTEVMVNGPDRIYVERWGRIEATSAAFVSDEHLLRIIDKIVSRIGRRIDERSPMVDARLPDGSRVNAVIPPLALTGPTLTVRKFSRDPFTMDDLVDFGTLSWGAVDLLEACVVGKMNVLVSGGTGTGKTTFLNALSAFLPADERIITIEDAAELQLHQEHVISLESRPPNVEGEGEVKIRDLVRNSLRMRPDRIIVGEVRGPETLDMLQAMNTGHEGSLTTIHANGPRDALSRLETLVLMTGLEIPLRAVREQIASALDVIIHLTRLVDGSRRVASITEVVGMESDVVTLQELFVARPPVGRAHDHGLSLLEPLAWTGLQPHFQHRLAARGVTLPDSFDEHVLALAGGRGQ